jgi:type II pantothenate kinase
MRLGETTLAGVSADVLPAGIVGIDVGMTLTKRVARRDGRIEASVSLTGAAPAASGTARASVTGARAALLGGFERRADVPELEAAARGAQALLAASGMDARTAFVVALLGTGTAFALVDGRQVRHLGGTALGGGSFAALARRIATGRSYDDCIVAAGHGDRRRADIMVADVYPEGIGRIGPDLTAAHLAKMEGAPSEDDVLAAVLNLHAENIGQIAASRGIIAGVRRLVPVGGFVHDNTPFVEAFERMAMMFGVIVEQVPAPGFAGAIGAAILGAEAA